MEAMHEKFPGLQRVFILMITFTNINWFHQFFHFCFAEELKCRSLKNIK